MSENQTIWKSNHQGFKEATFIQTGRRGGDSEINGEVRRCGVVQRGGGGGGGSRWVVPHSHVVHKNLEGYLGSEQPQPQARLHSPGFQCQEDKSL